ncbi:MAG: hypothetical protein RLZZ383_456 [Pseudomonadota bacterium]|jgi:hypothetical protein
MWNRIPRAVVACSVAAVALSLSSAAHAQVACDSISNGAPILYGAGGSAQTPLVGKAAVLFQASTDPVFIVYKDDGGACTGINALADVGPTVITGTAKYWDPTTGAQSTCTLPFAGAEVQFASMGNTALLCPLITDPSLVEGVTSVAGPISTVNLLVANASTQQAISAEALYFLYGFGGSAGIAPWTNPTPDSFIRRNENSYVQLYLAEATGLNAAAFYGVDATSNSKSVSLLAALAEPEAGISFASGEVADANRATVRTLAYQHSGQTAAYWPDSSATAFDKINVRNGAYYLWGPGYFYGRSGGLPGSFLDADVERFVNFFGGLYQPPGTTKTLTEAAIENKNVPQCAMNVQRDGDLGEIYAYTPEEPCGCFFDFKATGATTCDTCTSDADCGGGASCNFGYCEG